MMMMMMMMMMNCISEPGFNAVPIRVIGGGRKGKIAVKVPPISGGMSKPFNNEDKDVKFGHFYGTEMQKKSAAITDVKLYGPCRMNFDKYSLISVYLLMSIILGQLLMGY